MNYNHTAIADNLLIALLNKETVSALILETGILNRAP